MNTLLTNELKDNFFNWEPIKNVVFDCKNDKFPIEIEGVHSGFQGVLVSLLKDKISSPFIVVVPTEKEAQSFLLDLQSMGKDAKVLPWWGTIAYRSVPLSSAVFGQRAACLTALSSNKTSILVMTQRAFQTPVPPKDYLLSLIINLSVGMKFDPIKLGETLSSYGYTRVPRVSMRGEFALRGEVLDVFLQGDDVPCRIVFNFDTIEAIKTFTTEDQASVEILNSIQIYPSREVVWSDERIHNLEKNLLNKAEFPSKGEDVLTSLMVNRQAEGEELFYPLAFDKQYSIIDYLDENANLLFLDFDRLDNTQESLDREYQGLYRKARLGTIDDIKHEYPKPETILYSFRDLASKFSKRILFRTIHGQEQFAKERIIFKCDSPRSFFGNINYLKEELGVLFSQNWKVIICAESENQSLRITELLKDIPVTVIPQSISSGFGIPDFSLLVIQENEIFGRRKHLPKSVKHAKSAVIDTFVELNPGDYVVHVNYGIGQFKGIERVKALGNERDYIKLEYADDEIVFIPIEQVNLVQRYIGNEGDSPRLDTLGSKSWENRKNRVKQSVEDIAQKLIDLYSRRKAAQGFAFPKDTEWQTMFEAAFPYEETEDQLTCISEVKADMENSQPMDRLVCGDVGYGKTEVAMRAAFKACMGGKQVAFLSPTTILAEQHYETLKERFEKFPVRIAQLSRFVSKAEQKNILGKLLKGEIDILIGTHRIIQKDVVFKDLGLLMIDEEQRFGVKDKERLKELKNNIDCLALSATPIPRTLHMSLLKIRDMSLLTTPPYNRHPIETVIAEYNDDRVASAIRREVERGGQVFYLHNRVESLEETRIQLEHLVPEMMIETAHGKMSSQDLEDIFRRFKMGGFHVLVATTIVENGIDIPNVNTIIIDRADMYGVSQLYQLRGRVGRSDRKAYAYLYYPEGRAISEIAMKRLQVISDFTELGSGFKIAMKDMEIRGAGNLLGREQSGDIYSVGFDMYLRLLDEAVQRLSNENYQSEPEPLLELEYTGFVPDSYIPLPQIKMEVYKKIASISTTEELERVYTELSDRFGPVPDSVRSLLALSEIRIICKKLSIASLKEKHGFARVEFMKVSGISVEKVLRLMQESCGRLKLDPAQPNVLILQTGNIGLQEKSEYIREKLEAISD